MKKNIYQHKKTGKKVITSEKLDSKHWKKISEWRTGQMTTSQIRTQ